jgi:hypothetical protein
LRAGEVVICALERSTEYVGQNNNNNPHISVAIKEVTSKERKRDVKGYRITTSSVKSGPRSGAAPRGKKKELAHSPATLIRGPNATTGTYNMPFITHL